VNLELEAYPGELASLRRQAASIDENIANIARWKSKDVQKVYVVYWEDADYRRMLDNAYATEEKAFARMKQLEELETVEYADYHEKEVLV
jgi:hypothetical protein